MLGFGSRTMMLQRSRPIPGSCQSCTLCTYIAFVNRVWQIKAVRTLESPCALGFMRPPNPCAWRNCKASAYACVMYCKYVAGDWCYIAMASKLVWKQNITLEVHVAFIACLHLSLTYPLELAVEPNRAWSLILSYTYQTIVTLHLSCNSAFLFSQKTGVSQLLRFRLLLYFPCARAWVRAIRRHAFKGYDLFCTALDLAALKVRELLFLLRIYALLKRKKKKKSCHPSA